MNAYALAETERLLANLIRVGTVAALDAAAARVTVDVGGLTTDWLPWITGRADGAGSAHLAGRHDRHG